MFQEEAPGLFRIEVPLPGNPLKFLNAYLFRGEKRSLLIDTGFNMQESARALLGALDALHVERDALDLFITHLHSDHNGLVHLVASPNSAIYCSRRDGEKINAFIEDESLWPRSLANLGRHGFPPDEIDELVAAHPGKIYAGEKPIKFEFVNEGDELQYGAYRLRAVATPGHTPGHLCLHERERGFLISGDHILGSITPNITFWEGVRDSLGDYLESLDKCAALGVRQAFPGHRAVVENAGERIAELKAHHAARLDEAQSLVEKAGSACAWNVAAGMRWSLSGEWASYGVAQKCFAVGEAAAHLDHLVEKKRLGKETDQDGAISYVARRRRSHSSGAGMF